VAFTPEAGGFYVGDVFRGADEACRARNAQLIVIQDAIGWQAAVFHPDPIDDYLRIAEDLRDGVIAVTSVLPANNLPRLAQLKAPAVAIGGPPFDERGASVVIDNVGGAAMAVEHLIGHGHTRIGFVGAMDQFDVRQRYESYLATLGRAGITPDPALCFAAQDDLSEGGRQAAEAILEAGVPLTAIFASTDTQGVALMDRLREGGVHLPEDVAVVGFDDSELAQAAVPALTSIRQLPESLGSSAATLILDALDGRPLEPGAHVIPTQLVLRHSCGCYDNYQHLLEAAADWNGPDWREQLANVLAQALTAATMPAAETIDRTHFWPSVNVVVEALDDAIRGRRVTRISALDEAWWEASIRTRNAETLFRLVDLLEFVALCRQPDAGADPQALRSKLRDFLAQSRLQILRSAAIPDPLRHPTGPRSTRSILRSFLEDRGGKRQSLDWLEHVDAIAGCLALWEPGADGRAALRIEALYGATGGTQGGGTIAPEAFPPVHWLDACRIEGEPCAVMIVPVISARRNVGVLATALPDERRYYDGYWNLQHAAAVLALGLDTRD
jgi:DNA-binding LacI/PurR family transcriptional regulator